MERSRIGVIGCGLMGSGIAEVCARAGLDVVVVETSETARESGRAKLEQSLKRAEDKGRIGSASQALARIRLSGELTSVSDRDIVIEAIREDEAAKLDLFRELSRIVESPDAILASNTSSIPIMKLAAATTRPTHVVGIHFFNPVPVLTLVEIIPSLFTEDSVVARASAFVEGALEKKSILCQDRAGFVVNALLVPFILSAIRLLESGFASAADIDEGMVRGCAHPQGPLALADLIGLDTTKAVADSLYAEFKEPLYAPPPLLARMVEAGLLGRKSGRGFFSYS